MPRTTKFRTIDYPTIGESYKSPSRPLSVQRTVNLWPEAVKSGGLTRTALHHFPGLKTKATGAAGEFDRGTHNFANKLYSIAGGALYLIASTGARVVLGSIAGSAPIGVSDNGSTMVIVTGSGEYTYDGATLTSLSISGANTPTNVEFLNDQFIYDGNNGQVYISAVGLVTVPVGNTFKPSPAIGTLVRSFVFNQILYVFGNKGIEPWDNIGVGQPPFARINQGIIENTGLASRVGIDNTEGAIYFVSDIGEAIQLVGFQPKTISTVAIANAWRDYTLTDAVVSTFQFQSLDFVVFSFPTDGKTWGYVEQYDLWFELEHDTDGQRWLGNTITRAYGKVWVADYSSGNIYQLDSSTYTNNGVSILRERSYQPIAGETFGKPRQLYQMSALRISCETGIGTPTETDPRLMISMSTDGGKSFNGEVFKKLGAEGDYKEVETYSNRHFRDLTVRLRYTEKTPFSLYATSLDIREAGR